MFGDSLNWFMLSMSISSSGCTREVWGALKKLELLRFSCALQTFRVHQKLDIRTLSMNKLFLHFDWFSPMIQYIRGQMHD